MQKSVPFWRVCRVLANRPRLRILGLLSRRPGLRVTEVARALKLARPTGSQYLRALESCGFLVSRRIKRCIVYEVVRELQGQPLLRALIRRLDDKTAIESIFKLATAFANPGRIDVFRCLKSKPMSIAQLRAGTGWAGRTLRRHVKKLQNRGFIRSGPAEETYEGIMPADEFERAVAHAVIN